MAEWKVGVLGREAVARGPAAAPRTAALHSRTSGMLALPRTDTSFGFSSFLLPFFGSYRNSAQFPTRKIITAQKQVSLGSVVSRIAAADQYCIVLAFFVYTVLSGCGVYDGTEIHEASAILVHLSREGASVQMYAPDISQMHVIDHSKGQPAEGESRNVLAESARIARGKIADLAKLTAKDHDAVIFPGGFGAAKNLSTFAVDGKDCKVNGEVERVLKDFNKAGKPIGLCCISPVLAAKVLPGTEVTVGHEEEEGGKWPYAGTAGAIKALGGKHHIKEVTEAHVDTNHKVVTTPAFMCETELHHIYDGIGAMVKNVLKLTGK
uniref:glutamine amidotransferase-like class 1 domain-containing protein 3A, mitochondrial isoform X2 n=2 Tax=Podarcis TaxID=42163 RepID=UPI0010A03A9F|nr:glutamine amidotransferase-like class 1 domain-containing protein 3A, mitochondrial isoform X2 [Podarcis muralis]